jgi:hypothetical protein
MHDNSSWLLIGFLLGTILTSWAFVLSQSMTHSTLKTAFAMTRDDDEQIVFEPEDTTIENQDIRISLSEDEGE